MDDHRTGRSRTPLLIIALLAMLAGLGLQGAGAAEGDPGVNAYVGGVQQGPCTLNVGGCQFGLMEWGEGTEVTVKLYESKAKTNLLFETSLTFPAGGYAAVDGGGNEPGNHVVVSGGGKTVELTLREHAAEIDPVTDVVSGVSDKSGTIYTEVVSKEDYESGTPTQVVCRNASIAADGTWSVDFGAPEDTDGCGAETFDLGPGDWVQVALDAIAEPPSAFITTATVPDFTDDDGSVFEEEIGWLANQDITRGCNPPDNDEFCPEDPVTREQMAAFLNRALELDAAPEDFDDVPDGDTFAKDIGALAGADITRGCNPPDNNLFCPDDNVTRGQMAAFLYRALG